MPDGRCQRDGSQALLGVVSVLLDVLLNEEFDMLAGFDTFLATFRATISAG